MIWSLQSLRFAAAMMVVYVHAATSAFATTGSKGFLLHDFQVACQAGVDIFFVLSGVIIATTARGLTWRNFAWKRFRRIVPVYLFVSTPYAVLVAALAGFGWRTAVATLFLWPATDRMTGPAAPAAWSLCFEMLFYAAVTAVLVDRRLLLVVIGIFAAAMALRTHGPVFQFLGNAVIFEFLFGVALSYLPRWRPALWCLPVGAAALIATAFVGVAPRDQAVVELLVGDENLRRVLVYGVPAAMIVLGTMQIEAKPSLWTFLGDASYMLYLTHQLTILLFVVLWSVRPVAPELIIVVDSLACVLVAWGMYVRFEAPLLESLGRHTDRVRAVPVLRPESSP